MKELNVSSSNIRRAVELSRQLSGGAFAPMAAGFVSTQGFARFPVLRREDVGVAEASPAPAAAPVLRALPSIPASFASWDELLAWCLQSFAFDCAFVLDAQGFIISHRGRWSYDEVEGVGANLMLAMQQAERLEQLGEVHKLILHIGTSWVSAMQFMRSDREAYTVGLIGEKMKFEADYECLESVLAEQVDIV